MSIRAQASKPSYTPLAYFHMLINWYRYSHRQARLSTLMRFCPSGADLERRWYANKYWRKR